MESQPLPPPLPTQSKTYVFQKLEASYDRKSLKGEAFLCDLSCLKYEDYRDVYEPNEDTFLLIDALNMEAQNYLKELMPLNVLEIGVGSGAVINSLQMMMKANECLQKETQFIATDINIKALECAQKVATLNKNENIRFVEDKFATNLSQNGEKYDVIIFNPPYVVTSKEELDDAQEKKGIEASWAGGEDGTEVLMQVIPQIRKIMSKNGVFYLLLIQENLKIIGIFENLGFKWSVVMKREVQCENQLVLKLTFS